MPWVKRKTKVVVQSHGDSEPGDSQDRGNRNDDPQGDCGFLVYAMFKHGPEAQDHFNDG
jgi:hypothetical protein